MKSPTFVERLEASGVGAQLLAEEEAASLARRKALVADRGRLTSEREAEAPAYWEAIAAGEDGVKEAEGALKEARIRHGDSVIAQMGFGQKYQRLLDAIERELLEGASPLLVEFLGVLRNMHDVLANRPLGVEPKFARGMQVGQPLPEDIELFQTAVTDQADRLERINLAIPQVKGMFLEAVGKAELTARLDVLRRMVGVTKNGPT